MKLVTFFTPLLFVIGASMPVIAQAQVAAPFVSLFNENAEKPPDADGFPTYFDGRKYLSSEKTVGSPHEVQKTPIVDNAPCLRLKAGDQLVKGRRWFQMGKGEGPSFDDSDSYFLSSKGKFYDLGSYDSEPKFNLNDPTYSLRFDWDLTLKNATQLYQISKNSSLFSYSLTIEHYRALREKLRKDFSASLRGDPSFVLKAPRLEGDDKEKYAAFENVSFDTSQNTVFHYRVLIGPNIYEIKRKPLLIGPSRIERWEFEGLDGGGINGPMPYHPDPQTAAQARADYRKSQAFRRVVASFLPAAQRAGLLSLRE